MLSRSLNKKNTYYFIAFLIVGFIFIMPLANRELWWGIHFYTYLPPPLPYILVSLLLLTLLIPLRYYRKAEEKYRHLAIPENAVIVCLFLLPVLAFPLFYQHNIETDIYGDSRVILNRLTADSNEVFEAEQLTEIFHPNIFRKGNGEYLTSNAVKIIRTHEAVDTFHAFKIWNALWGSLYLLVLAGFVFSLSRQVLYVVTMFGIGLAPGFMSSFLGYSEVYAPALCLSLLYLFCLYHLLAKPGWWRLTITALALVAAIKSHITLTFLLPSFILAAGHMIIPNLQIWHIFRKPSKTLLWIVLPGTLLFFFAVYMGLGNYNTSHVLNPNNNSEISRHIFLPILKEAPPLDRYSLFSSSHSLDFINLVLFWSAPAILIVLLALCAGKKAVWPFSHRILFLNLVTGLLLFFFINPILSMPRDWDMMSMPATSLLAVALVILPFFPWSAAAGLKLKTLFVSVILAIICLTSMWVNTDKPMISERLTDVGVHIYKTYWAGSAYILNVACNPLKSDTLAHIELRKEIVKRVEPYAVKRVDTQFADLLAKLGELYFMKRDWATATAYFEKSARYGQTPNSIYMLMAGYFNQRQYDKAMLYAPAVVQAFPNDPDKLKICFEIAARNKNYNLARSICNVYLKAAPGDPQMQAICSTIPAQ